MRRRSRTDKGSSKGSQCAWCRPAACSGNPPQVICCDGATDPKSRQRVRAPPSRAQPGRPSGSVWIDFRASLVLARPPELLQVARPRSPRLATWHSHRGPSSDTGRIAGLGARLPSPRLEPGVAFCDACMSGLWRGKPGAVSPVRILRPIARPSGECAGPKDGHRALLGHLRFHIARRAPRS